MSLRIKRRTIVAASWLAPSLAVAVTRYLVPFTRYSLLTTGSVFETSLVLASIDTFRLHRYSGVIFQGVKNLTNLIRRLLFVPESGHLPVRTVRAFVEDESPEILYFQSVLVGDSPDHVAAYAADYAYLAG